MDEWRELRYGKGFLSLTRDQLRSVAAEIVNGDASTAENVLVLVDEIERRAYSDDRISLSSLCIDVRDSVMPYTIEFSDLAQQLTERRGRSSQRERKREVMKTKRTTKRRGKGKR